MNSEDQLIERIASAVPSGRAATGKRSRADFPAGARLLSGIGDDSALLAPGGRTEWVVSCDAFIEGIHFQHGGYPADSVGFKSLARATSDLAAMGATPRFFLLTLALPAERKGKWLDQFARGMGRAARRLKMVLIGGDTTKNDSVFISITVLGEIPPGMAVKRSGARPGDLIYVSGRLGGAQLGLEFLKRSGKSKIKSSQGRRSPLLEAHLYPNIRVDLGCWLARERIVSAMIDISDGLSTDLNRLCVASKVGARIWAGRIPSVELPDAKSAQPAFRKFAHQRLDPLEMALHGGEDYELLFTVPPKHSKRLRQAPGFQDITAIGEIEHGKQVTLVGAKGTSKRLLPGWVGPFLPREITQSLQRDGWLLESAPGTSRADFDGIDAGAA